MTMIEKARRNRVVALVRLRVARSRPAAPQFRTARRAADVSGAAAHAA